MITTLEGHHIPLCIKDGLPYMKMSKSTQQDIDAYPHVTMTADTVWDPSTYDEDWEATDTGEQPTPTDDGQTNDDVDYGEEFTPHELNVNSCIQDAKNSSDCTSNPGISINNNETTPKVKDKPKDKDKSLGGTIIPP